RAARIGRDRIFPERLDQRLDRAAVHGNHFVADDEGKLRLRQTRAVDGVDQDLAVIDVERQRQRGAERRREGDEVVRVVERRDVFDQGFLEVEIVGVGD